MEVVRAREEREYVTYVPVVGCLHLPGAAYRRLLHDCHGDVVRR